MRRARRFFAVLSILLTLAALATAQSGLPPLPQDTGSAGLQQEIQHLRNTGRFLHTTAHPDDEDGGLMTLLSRGMGVHVTLLTLNRGEGGQNRTGSGLFDELGVLRTLELTAADRYYGVDQRFTRVVDFGYSKTAAETFEKWGGHDVALGDMVRIIRTLRPDVIVSRFQGNSGDGHGNHEAAGILTKEAFRAAGDPNRFPEQIQQGLQPWQAKKVYTGTGFRDNPDYTVILETTQESPFLGMNYFQFAMQGLRHQVSQGVGSGSPPAGKRFVRYKLIDSVLPNTLDANGHERDFFDGIDTSIAGLGKRLGADAHKAERLPGMFRDLQSKLDAAAEAAKKDSHSAAKPLAEADGVLGQIAKEIDRVNLSKVVRDDLTAHLPTQADVEHAINLAEGATIDAKSTAAASPSAQLVVPGQQFTVAVDLHAPSGAKLRDVKLMVPEGWNVADADGAKTPLGKRFTVHVARAAQYTKPYFHRDNADTDSIYKIDNSADLGLPFVPAPVKADVEYEVEGITSHVIEPVLADSVLEGGTRAVPIAVAPEASVLFEEPSRVVRTDQTQPVEVTVRVRSSVDEIRDGELSLITGSAWRVEPASQPVELKGKGSEKSYKFFLFPSADRELRFEIHAKLTISGRDYYQGFSTVTRSDLATAYYYQPAIERVSVVRLQLPQNYSVGYIMGAGDDIPTVLRQAGLSVKLISNEELTSGDLSKYRAIVLGIRAYDVNEDVKKNNARLLSFVEKGGTLVVQYNSAVGDFTSGNYAPYPLELSRDRVSVEQAPVEILDPKDLIFNDPNDINQADFNGWVQERGLYFAKSWGGKFVPLLRSNDPGEPPLDGGLVRAWYGKGTYVYTGYAFFRQLPYGVPGALRLFVNLLSAHQ